MAGQIVKERLAIHGGPKAVSASGLDRWPVIPVEEAKKRIGDLLDQGIISVGDGSGGMAEFEEDFRKWVGTRYGLAMNNGRPYRTALTLLWAWAPA